MGPIMAELNAETFKAKIPLGLQSSREELLRPSIRCGVYGDSGTVGVSSGKFGELLTCVCHGSIEEGNDVSRRLLVEDFGVQFDGLSRVSEAKKRVGLEEQLIDTFAVLCRVRSYVLHGGR